MKYGISIDDAAAELKQMCESAVDFIFSENEKDWTKAEKYYNGGTDLEMTVGRSNVVKTEVRDAIRNLKPSVMRTLLHARKIVNFLPVNVLYGDWATYQSLYLTQLFWKCDGYRQISSAFDDAAKLRIAPLKVYWVENPTAYFFEYKNVTADRIMAWEEDDSVEIEEIIRTDPEDEVSEDVITFTVRGYYSKSAGEIRFEAVPPYEFFIDRNSDTIAAALASGVHGHRRIVTVEEALELDIDFDAWEELDYDDPEQNEHSGSSYFRRRYQKQGSQPASKDPLKQEFLLTEAYARFDLKGIGVSQLYKFWLGGSSYRLLDYEEVEDSPMELMVIDPVAHNAIGNSIADITVNEQDLNTSIVRAIADNFHMANNPRPVGDPVRVDFDDLMSNQIGAPIKSKGEYVVQWSSVPFTGQAGLPLLQYLETDVQSKTGITKASQGLDPDAMQSTDKQAVLNTIQQGAAQQEWIVRNMIETGLIPIFRKMLRLSMRHGDPTAMVQIYGRMVEVPQGIFDPDLLAEPAVGLGTGSPQERSATLQFILGKQEQIMQTEGPGNALTSYEQMYNTIEDLCELGGVKNVGRYFNMITPDIEKQIAQGKAEAAKAAAENAPMDPSKAMLEIEAMKQETAKQKQLLEHREKQLELEQKALVDAENIDIERDKLAQTRVIELAKIKQTQHSDQIKKEQAENDSRQRRLQTESSPRKSG